PGGARQPTLLHGELRAGRADKSTRPGAVVCGVGDHLRAGGGVRRYLHPHAGREGQLVSRAQRRVVGRVFFYLLIGVIFVYLMFPFYWAIVSALKTQAELIQTPATLWPTNPVLTNFAAVLSNDRFVRALLNSTIVAGAVTILSLLVGSFAGYALGQMPFRRQEPA